MENFLLNEKQETAIRVKVYKLGKPMYKLAS